MHENFELISAHRTSDGKKTLIYKDMKKVIDFIKVVTQDNFSKFDNYVYDYVAENNINLYKDLYSVSLKQLFRDFRIEEITKK